MQGTTEQIQYLATFGSGFYAGLAVEDLADGFSQEVVVALLPSATTTAACMFASLALPIRLTLLAFRSRLRQLWFGHHRVRSC